MSSAQGVKISELSRTSGVPLATIKFYLREGLLPPGTRTGPNQAVYGRGHESRLRLIRLMRDVGGLGIATIRDILQLMDQAEGTAVVPQVADAIADQSGPRIAPELTHGEARPEAAAAIDALLDGMGWRVRRDSRARERLIDAFVALRATIEPNLPIGAIAMYAEVALALARRERQEGIRNLDAGLEGAIQGIVAGTILWEMVLTTLRRMAHEHLSSSGDYDDWLATWLRENSHSDAE